MDSKLYDDQQKLKTRLMQIEENLDDNKRDLEKTEQKIISAETMINDTRNLLEQLDTVWQGDRASKFQIRSNQLLIEERNRMLNSLHEQKEGLETERKKLWHEVEKTNLEYYQLEKR